MRVLIQSSNAQALTTIRSSLMTKIEGNPLFGPETVGLSNPSGLPDRQVQVLVRGHNLRPNQIPDVQLALYRILHPVLGESGIRTMIDVGPPAYWPRPVKAV